jgi:hypothetical protein
MMPDENGPAVPRIRPPRHGSSCRHDPVRAFAPVLTSMPGQQIPLGDILGHINFTVSQCGWMGLYQQL